MAPPGLSQRSRAAMTGTSIPSSIPNPPSHSETTTSTRSGGSISRMSPWMTWTISCIPVRGGQLLREDRDRRLFHCVDACRTRPCREQAQDAAARPDVENDVAGAHDRVDRSPECLCADAVADHRPVYFEFRVHRVRWMFDRRTHSQTVNDPPMADLADGPLAAPAAAAPSHCFIGQPQNATRCHATCSSSPPTEPLSMAGHAQGHLHSSRVRTWPRRTISPFSPFPDDDGSHDPWHGSNLIEDALAGRTGRGSHGIQATDTTPGADRWSVDCSPQGQDVRRSAGRGRAASPRTTRARTNTRRRRRTRPTRSNTSHSCTHRAR